MNSKNKFVKQLNLGNNGLKFYVHVYYKNFVIVIFFFDFY